LPEAPTTLVMLTMRPVALLHHRAHHGAAHPEDGLQVGVQHRVPVVVLHAHGERVARDAGVVHQHVQRTVLPGDRVDQRFGRLRIVDVQPGTTAVRVLGQRLRDLLRAFVGGGGADHLHAAHGEFVGDRRTDTPRGSRHQGNLAVHVDVRAHASIPFASASVAGS
jgi:hypothetical protein